MKKMKTINDENRVIDFHSNLFKRIWLRIILKYSRFKYWLSRKELYKKLYYKYLWKFRKINFIEPFEQNSWDEASINLNKSIRDEAIKQMLINMKKEMGEEKLLKILKKKLSRKEYKRTMGDIIRWKKKGIWI